MFKRAVHGFSWRSAAAVRWLTAGAVLAVLFGNRGFRQLVANSWELRRLRGEHAELVRARRILEEKAQKLRDSDFFVESVARRDLGYVRPGELEYRFPPPTR